MKILFLHRIWPVYGGGETVTKCLLKEFIRRGHEVYVLFTKQSEKTDDLPDTLHQQFIQGVSFDENSTEFFINKKEAHKVSSVLVDYINGNNIDVVINQWWPVEFLRGVKKKTNTRIVKCIHMDPDTKKVIPNVGFKGKVINLMLPLYRLIEHYKHMYSVDKYVRHSDKVIFLAPTFLDFYRNMRKGNKVVEQKTDFVFNPLVYQVEGKIPIAEKEHTVLFVGRLLEKHKQISRILAAWEILQNDSIAKDWDLKIVGDGPDRFQYERIIKEHKLQRVSMEGFMNPLPYYRRACILVMTSAYEGLPMTIVESQQNGVVPIAMDSYRSVHDIIKDGYNGYIVADNDIESFTNRIKLLMKDEALRNEMAERGYESCCRFSVDKVVDKWEKIFAELGKKDS